ncbi:hypothetical protein [Streptomyces sp. CA-253872]|uniref:hypothetical protein n=1 Tax=Streptomyces sp. CA-253872 TaxID=3240067 RepID=UPI003D93E804
MDEGDSHNSVDGTVAAPWYEPEAPVRFLGHVEWLTEPDGPDLYPAEAALLVLLPFLRRRRKVAGAPTASASPSAISCRSPSCRRSRANSLSPPPRPPGCSRRTASPCRGTPCPQGSRSRPRPPSLAPPAPASAPRSPHKTGASRPTRGTRSTGAGGNECGQVSGGAGGGRTCGRGWGAARGGSGAGV